jgi:hypothetical protein
MVAKDLAITGGDPVPTTQGLRRDRIQGCLPNSAPGRAEASDGGPAIRGGRGSCVQPNG